MKKEDAIKIATGLRTDFKCESDTMVDFCNTIIKALEQEPCEDCVSRQAVLEQTYSWCKDEFLRTTNPFDYLRKRINALPPIQPKAKVGKWIIDDKERNIIWHCHCSECNKDPQDYIGGTENWWLVRLPNNCPNCGAKMKSEDKK